MTNLTLEFKKLLEVSMKELTDLLEAKNFELAIAASKEINACLEECSKLCISNSDVVSKIEDFAEQADKKAKQPAAAINATGIEELFQRLDPTIKVGVKQEQELELNDTEEKIGIVGIFKGWHNAGKKKIKAVE